MCPSASASSTDNKGITSKVVDDEAHHGADASVSCEIHTLCIHVSNFTAVGPLPKIPARLVSDLVIDIAD
ncbi:unnamed protein product [Hydatigera taeniaeformis]|uniref:Uncharacterized protein n=1 Tax=Hydatigena taeniaeformis TaxID=6205 RepID=A0A0R3WY10_HYDTA|nr:unnamed protein product [Hydatigera taeniaeformis]